MKIKLVIILSIITTLMLGVAMANPTILNKFTTEYDNSGTTLSTCKTCMDKTTAPASWNSYGLALKSDPDFDRTNPATAFKNIEQLDSDGDGFLNIDEIHNLTFPGDPNDFPVTSTVEATMEPTVVAIMTEEQTMESMPAQTEQENTNSIMNAAVSLLVILIVFFFIRRK